MTTITWLQVPGFPDYDASTSGLIRRARKSYANAHRGRPTPYILKQSVGSSGGYLIVQMQNEGGWKMMRVHRIIALTFLGPEPSGKGYVAHNDGNPLNNDLSNLRWASPKENAADTLIHGTRNRGALNGFSKLTAQDVISIRQMRASGRTYKAIAQKFDITPQCASDVSNRKTWRHI